MSENRENNEDISRRLAAYELQLQAFYVQIDEIRPRLRRLEAKGNLTTEESATYDELDRQYLGLLEEMMVVERERQAFIRKDRGTPS